MSLPISTYDTWKTTPPFECDETPEENCDCGNLAGYDRDDNGTTVCSECGEPICDDCASWGQSKHEACIEDEDARAEFRECALMDRAKIEAEMLRREKIRQECMIEQYARDNGEDFIWYGYGERTPEYERHRADRLAHWRILWEMSKIVAEGGAS